MLTKVHRGPTRPAAGRPGASSAGIAAALTLAVLLALGPRPLPAALGGGDGLAPAGSDAVSGGSGAADHAVLPGLPTDATPPRATWRTLRTETKRGVGGAASPPETPPPAPWPASAAEEIAGAPGAQPAVRLIAAHHGGFHLRLIGTPRTPTGPPAARA